MLEAVILIIISVSRSICGLFKDGKYLESDTYYDKLARECPYQKELIWGGTWKSLHDAPHYQLAKYGNSTARN